MLVCDGTKVIPIETVRKIDREAVGACRLSISIARLKRPDQVVRPAR
jgi:hypothetical protein